MHCLLTVHGLEREPAAALEHQPFPMSKKDAPARPEARLPKGLFDVPGAGNPRHREDAGHHQKGVKSYGFEPLDTPAIEYTDTLGKFLPDQDRPNEGVFSFKDDDAVAVAALRYDGAARPLRGGELSKSAETVPALPGGAGMA